MQNLTALSVGTVGRVQMTSSAFRTSEPSSRRYAGTQQYRVSLLTPVYLGAARTFAVLVGVAALFDRRLCV